MMLSAQLSHMPASWKDTRNCRIALSSQSSSCTGPLLPGTIPCQNQLTVAAVHDPGLEVMIQARVCILVR